MTEEIVEFRIEIDGIDRAINSVDDLEQAIRDVRAAIDANKGRGVLDNAQLDQNLRRLQNLREEARRTQTQIRQTGVDGAKSMGLLREGADGAGAALEILSGENSKVGFVVMTTMKAIGVANSIREVSENRATAATIANTIATKANIVVQKIYDATLKGTIVSLNAFKIALVSTGVGALVVGLGVLVSYLMSTGNEAKGASDGLDEATASMGKLNAEIAKGKTDTELLIERLRALGAAESVLQAVRLGEIQTEINAKQQRFNELKEKEKETTDEIVLGAQNNYLAFVKGVDMVRTAQNNLKTETKKLTQAERVELGLLETDLKKLNYQYETQKIILGNILAAEQKRGKETKKTTTAVKERTQEEINANFELLSKMLDDDAAAEKTLLDEKIKALEKRRRVEELFIIGSIGEDNKRKEKMLETEIKFMVDLYNLKKKFGDDDLELLKQLKLKGEEYANFISGLVLEQEAIFQKSYQSGLKAIELAAMRQGLSEFEEKQKIRRAEIVFMEKHYQNLIKLGKANTDEAIELEKQIILKKRELRADDIKSQVDEVNGLTDVLKAGFQAQMDLDNVRTQNLLNNDKLTEEQREKIAREGFEKQKKLQLQMAYVDAAKSITSIIAQYPKFDGGIAMFAALATTAIMNTAAIARIMKTQYQGGGSGSGSGAPSEASKFARGGLLIGPLHSSGGIKTSFGELEGGEFVINRNSTRMYPNLISAINMAGGGKKFAMGGMIGVEEQLRNMERGMKAQPVIRTYVLSGDISSAVEAEQKIKYRTSI